VLLGFKYAKRSADENHPYWHGKIEPLITFLVVTLLVLSAVIAHQAIENIQTPHPSPKLWTLYVLGAIIIWKEVSYRIVMKKKQGDAQHLACCDAWHYRSDAITSVMAFVGISISLVFGKGFETADDWAALLAAGYIVYNSYLIFRPAVGEIMDEQVYDDLMEEIRNVSLTVDGVIGTEKCFIRKAGMHYNVDLHAIVDGSINVKERYHNRAN